MNTTHNKKENSEQATVSRQEVPAACSYLPTYNMLNTDFKNPEDYLPVTLKCQIDMDKSLYLLTKRKNDFDSQAMMNLLSHLRKQCKNGNHVVSEYRPCSRVTKEGCIRGRLYPVHGKGISALPRDIRAFICAKHNWDCDMKAAHPTIFVQVCEKKGIACPVLRDAVENRDAYFEKLYKASPPSKNVKMPTSKSSYMSKIKPAYELSKCLCPIMSVVDWLKEDDDIGHLCFSNGVLDMTSYVMKPFDPKYRFKRSIKRYFDTSIDYTDTLIPEIEARMFDNPFTDKLKKDYYIEKIARGIAGEYNDREFVFAIGETSCGKGTTTKLLKNAFSSYVADFNAEDLLTKDSENGDVARQFSWLIDISDARIAISNEIQIKVKQGKPKGINCNLVKRLTGGGDAFKARKCFKDERTIINKSTMFMHVNDIPVTEGADEAYIVRANYITYDRSSLTDLEVPSDMYFRADPSVNDFVNRVDVANALTQMMCLRYKASKDNKMARPASVVHVSKEMSGFNDTDIQKFLQDNYVVTVLHTVKSWVVGGKNERGLFLVDWRQVGDNYVTFDLLYEAYLKQGNTISVHSFGRKLSTIGYVKTIKKIDGKTCYVIVGIREPSMGEDGDAMDPPPSIYMMRPF